MTTIQLSYNEAQTLARKAANGAGLPHGVAEDIGGAAVWLSARGVDAIGVVVAALSDCQPAILAGQAAIDALCCGESDEVNVDDDNSRLLLIGLAGAAAMNMGLSVAVGFRNGDVVSLAQVSNLADQASSIEALRLTSRNTDDMSERLVSRRPAATDTKAYAAALGLAAKTYVPASELSRIQGAGAGTTDND